MIAKGMSKTNGIPPIQAIQAEQMNAARRPSAGKIRQAKWLCHLRFCVLSEPLIIMSIQDRHSFSATRSL